jgi:hypothetical protein
MGKQVQASVPRTVRTSDGQATENTERDAERSHEVRTDPEERHLLPVAFG